MIHSILANIPIYQLSFFKAPAIVVKECIRIQREFLFGGMEGQINISWLSWSKICSSKFKGGLGDKHCGAFNLAQLSKWFGEF